MAFRKTRLVKDVESQQKRGPIESWLPTMVKEIGYQKTSEAIGVSKGTVQNWIADMGLKFESQRRLVAVAGVDEGGND